MSISNGSNVSAMRALRYLNEHNRESDKSMERISSGVKLNDGSDPAGLAIASQLNVELRSNAQAQRNVADARSMIQVTQGGLNEINNSLLRLRELALSAASDYGEREREFVMIEADSLKNEIGRLAETTTFQGIPLLNGQGKDVKFFVGTVASEENQVPYVTSMIDARPDSLGVDDVNLEDQDSALNSLETIDNALRQMSVFRAHAGSFHSRLNSIDSQLKFTAEPITARLSRIQDTDLAEETSRYAQRQILTQSTLAVLTQANTSQRHLLRLIDGEYGR